MTHFKQTHISTYSRMYSYTWISMFKTPDIQTGNDGMPFDNVKLRHAMRRLHERMTVTEFMKKRPTYLFIYLFKKNVNFLSVWSTMEGREECNNNKKRPINLIEFSFRRLKILEFWSNENIWLPSISSTINESIFRNFFHQIFGVGWLIQLGW